MSDNAARFTPGPWSFQRSPVKHDDAYDFAIHAEGAPVIAEVFGRDAKGGFPPAEANARLMAASPTMADAIKGLIGLCQMLRNRDDCPSEIRQALTHNHRIIAGYEALSAAGIEGFQPSDFDAARASISKEGEQETHVR